MGAIVTGKTKFTVSGRHTCGDDWIPFTKTESLDKELEEMLTIEDEKTAVVGSYWKGPLSCGVSLKVEMESAKYDHEVNGKKISTEDDGNDQMKFTFYGGQGVAKFERWSEGNKLFDIDA